MRVSRREAAVIASAVDRTGVAYAGLARHGNVFIVAEADDDVRRPAVSAVLGLDEAHGQRPCDLAIPVAHEDRAELQPTLHAYHSGFHRLDVTVRHEKIVTARVRGDHDGSRGNRLRHGIAWRGVFLRPAAN